MGEDGGFMTIDGSSHTTPADSRSHQERQVLTDTRGDLMPESNHLLVFTLDENQYALNLSSVERVVRAVEVTPLPHAPDIILGIIDVQGRVIPVVSGRRRFDLPDRGIDLNDRFVMVRSGEQSFAVVADDVRPVVELSGQSLTSAEDIVDGLEYVAAVARVDDSMLIVLEPESILTRHERRQLKTALEETETGFTRDA
jgi:purine-binding chemotaxis protein CheW